MGTVGAMAHAHQSAHGWVRQNHIGFDGHITGQVLWTCLLLLFYLQEVRGLLGRDRQFGDLSLTILTH